MFLTETLKHGIQVTSKKFWYTSLSNLRGEVPAYLLPYFIIKSSQKFPDYIACRLLILFNKVTKRFLAHHQRLVIAVLNNSQQERHLFHLYLYLESV
jgi:hypothetical protein